MKELILSYVYVNAADIITKHPLSFNWDNFEFKFTLLVCVF